MNNSEPTEPPVSEPVVVEPTSVQPTEQTIRVQTPIKKANFMCPIDPAEASQCDSCQ